MFRAQGIESYELFLLSKEQLISEIVNRATTTTFSAYQSSQGSGIINKLTQAQKIDRLYENLAGNQFDKINWYFNTNTEQELYQHFKEKYKIDANDIKAKVNLA